MNTYQQLVSEFNKAVESPRSTALRASLIAEEGKETVDAIEAKDPVELIDGLCDLLYVVYGAADTFDLELSTPHTFFTASERPLGWAQINELLENFKGSIEKAVSALDTMTEEVGTYEVKHYLENLANKCWIIASQCLAIDLDPFFREVHRANMEKLKGPKREDGKQLKPEGWQPPRIAEMYAELGEREL